MRAGSPDPALIQLAAEKIRAGGVVVCPTSALYGLAADPFQPAAVERVYAIKGRPAHQPLLVLVDSLDALPRLATAIPPAARDLMERFWPGGLTLVMAAHPSLPPALTGGTTKIGIRQTAHPVARALAAASNGVVTGTSANRSGHPGCARIADLDPDLVAEVDLILDAGQLAGGLGSSVMDCTADPPQLIREGALSAEDLKRA